MTYAGTADYTLGTATYWDDDHMQEVLDRHRIDIERETLQTVPRYSGGTIVYKEFRSQYRPLESGTAVWWLETSAGSAIGTAGYSVDYSLGIITFTADQQGTAYAMTGRTFDVNAAAADVWSHKASYYADHVNFSTDNHRVDLGSLVQHCNERANFYRGKSNPQVITWERGDYNACGDDD